jgi:hypothetical protein
MHKSFTDHVRLIRTKLNYTISNWLGSKARPFTPRQKSDPEQPDHRQRHQCTPRDNITMVQPSLSQTNTNTCKHIVTICCIRYTRHSSIGVRVTRGSVALPDLPNLPCGGIHPTDSQVYRFASSFKPQLINIGVIFESSNNSLNHSRGIKESLETIVGEVMFCFSHVQYRSKCLLLLLFVSTHRCFFTKTYNVFMFSNMKVHFRA